MDVNYIYIYDDEFARTPVTISISIYISIYLSVVCGGGSGCAGGTVLLGAVPALPW